MIIVCIICVLQVTYTIATWLHASANGFRHNDLHASNVCVCYWRDDHAPVTAQYVLVDESGVMRLFELRTPFRAVIVDFEYAALLPHAGGTPFDRRFYQTDKFALTAAGDIFETTFAEHGISHTQVSVHYDVCLFVYSCYSLLMKDAAHATAAEFGHSYRHHFRNFHRKSSLTFSGSGAGRLLPRVQASLAVSTGAGRDSPLPSAAVWLCTDAFFGSFRVAEFSAAPGAHVFGQQTTLFEDAITTRRATCMLAKATHAWRPRLDSYGRLVSYPLAGAWTTLQATWTAMRAAASPSRPMTPLECIEWLKLPSVEDFVSTTTPSMMSEAEVLLCESPTEQPAPLSASPSAVVVTLQVSTTHRRKRARSPEIVA
jgi:hypothetical protein